MDNLKFNDSAAKRQKILPEALSRTTKGDLDPIFFQHAAFPMVVKQFEDDDVSREVFEYLNSVRKEAEADQCIHFAEDKTQSFEQNDLRNHRTRDASKEESAHREGLRLSENVEVSNEWKLKVMTALLDLKEQTRNMRDKILLTDSSEIIIPLNASSWRRLVFQSPVPPIEFFIIQLDHLTIIKLVIYFTKWLSGSIDQNLSRWIWLLFIRLDAPLDVNETSIIRDLGKKALKLCNHKRFHEFSELSRITIKTTLVIVSEYFGQRDLLD
ncbi:uncharacterized protein PRCAT00001892001 [Priceomyces carsonii]|uniref:uncharacterized protein n=1 Tax=Priceomyces carsonii TaxID=28549 RepID=UPI002EDB4BB8|nr:unnamed protein product [Priceomyces carsonii]